jgi:hypothetical protein
MHARVMWTYVANYSEEPFLLRSEPHMIETNIFVNFSHFSEKFFQKATFHVFWENGDYEKIPAERVKALALV